MKLYGGKLFVKQLIKFLEASYKDIPPEHIDGYDLDKSLSTEYVKVYYNPSNKRAIVAHRGSSTLDDAITDVKMTFGFKGDKRHQISKEIQRKANAKYGDSSITVIGHSLGATLAEDNLKPSNKEGIVVSKPVLPKDILIRRKKPLNQFEIRSQYDPTSILKGLQPDQSDIIVPALTYDPIIEHNYKAVLERLPMNKLIGKGREKKKYDNNIYMNVRDLKAYIIQNRPNVHGYSVSKKTKQQLINLYEGLRNNEAPLKTTGRYRTTNARKKELISNLYKNLKSKVSKSSVHNKKAILTKIREMDVLMEDKFNDFNEMHLNKLQDIQDEIYKSISNHSMELADIREVIDKIVTEIEKKVKEIDDDVEYVTGNVKTVDKKVNDVETRLDKIEQIVDRQSRLLKIGQDNLKDIDNILYKAGLYMKKRDAKVNRAFERVAKAMKSKERKKAPEFEEFDPPKFEESKPPKPEKNYKVSLKPTQAKKPKQGKDFGAEIKDFVKQEKDKNPRVKMQNILFLLMRKMSPVVNIPARTLEKQFQDFIQSEKESGNLPMARALTDEQLLNLFIKFGTKK